MDPEATFSDFFSLGTGGAQSERQALPRSEFLARVTALMQSCKGCEKVDVIDVTPLDGPDADGCNWSFTLVLEPAGVPAEVYGLAYAQVIATARSGWNLQQARAFYIPAKSSRCRRAARQQ